VSSTQGSPSAGWYSDPHGAPVLRWWDGSSWTDQVATPSARRHVLQQPRDSLRWIAGAFLAPWCAMGVVVGVFGFVDATVEARGWASGQSWHNPIPFQASMLVFVLWILSMNLLVPGLALGVVSIARDGRHRVARAVTLPTLVVAGCIAEFAALALGSDNATPTDFVHGGRLASLIVSTVAVLVALGAAKLLGLLSVPSLGRIGAARDVDSDDGRVGRGPDRPPD
jgi:uncharacterized protein DUF2510